MKKGLAAQRAPGVDARFVGLELMSQLKDSLPYESPLMGKTKKCRPPSSITFSQSHTMSMVETNYHHRYT